VTLLTPFKHITTFKLSKLPIFDGVRQIRSSKAASVLVNRAIKAPIVVSESDPAPLPLSPSEILEQIGSKLREWREYHHLSIDDMSARTQIQPRLIYAIESGLTEMLPESVYVKGMIRRYADNLGLDGTEIAQHMLSWESTTAKVTVISRQKTQGFSPVPQIKPFHVYLGYTLAICGIGAGTSHFLNDSIKPQPTPIAKSSPKPVKAVVAAPAVVQLPDVPIGIAVKAPTWAQIGIDGTTKFTGGLKVGTQFNWTAQKQVTISTNNAGGLLFARDGKPLQPLGKNGEKQNVTIKVVK
jgi:cytoskeletal protein RodZ